MPQGATNPQISNWQPAGNRLWAAELNRTELNWTGETAKRRQPPPTTTTPTTTARCQLRLRWVPQFLFSMRRPLVPLSYGFIRSYIATAAVHQGLCQKNLPEILRIRRFLKDSLLISLRYWKSFSFKCFLVKYFIYIFFSFRSILQKISTINKLYDFINNSIEISTCNCFVREINRKFGIIIIDNLAKHSNMRYSM